LFERLDMLGITIDPLREIDVGWGTGLERFKWVVGLFHFVILRGCGGR
jgi:hypothetical protein